MDIGRFLKNQDFIRHRVCCCFSTLFIENSEKFVIALGCRNAAENPEIPNGPYMNLAILI